MNKNELDLNEIIEYPTDYFNDMDKLTNEQLSVLVISLSSDNTPRSMFTRASIELCSRFTDIKPVNSEVASLNLSAGLAKPRNTRSMKAVKESYL
jgi:hypothetical protein